MVTWSGDTWSQLSLEESHTNMDISAVFGCYQDTPPQTSTWLWFDLCLLPQHCAPLEKGERNCR